MLSCHRGKVRRPSSQVVEGGLDDHEGSKRRMCPGGLEAAIWLRRYVSDESIAEPSRRRRAVNEIRMSHAVSTRKGRKWACRRSCRQAAMQPRGKLAVSEVSADVVVISPPVRRCSAVELRLDSTRLDSKEDGILASCSSALHFRNGEIEAPKTTPRILGRSEFLPGCVQNVGFPRG